MIIAFHITWTTYGHWFPNDPRGSWSSEVWEPRLATVRGLDNGQRVMGPRPVAKPELQEFLDSARPTLRFKTINLGPPERRLVADTFGEITSAIDLTIRACAILTNHVHIVFERPRTSFERVVNRLKGRSSQTIRTSRGIPGTIDRRERVPIWSQGYWCRYIDNEGYLARAIRYVERHKDARLR